MPEATNDNNNNVISSPNTKPGDHNQSIIIGSSNSIENIGTSTTTTANNSTVDNNNGEDMLLVTEFPPPPYYYTLASSSNDIKLTPPEIPHRAFRVAAKRVRQEKERARLESEKIRLEAEMGEGSSSSNSNSGGRGGNNEQQGGGGDDDDDDKSSSDVVMTDKQQQENTDDDDNDSIIDPNDPNEPIVAVFGEIVEDPTLVYVEEECNNPTILVNNVKRLNQSVLQGFLKLVTTLVNDPIENKKSRDVLSHNIFVMLQECNKFREHQAREILIETLERQLERREGGLEVLRGQIGVVEDALDGMELFRKEKQQQQQQQQQE